MTKKEIEQLKKLQDKQRQELKEQKQFNKKIKELNLSTKWYEICGFYGISSNEEMEQLFNHICSDRQRDYYYRSTPHNTF